MTDGGSGTGAAGDGTGATGNGGDGTGVGGTGKTGNDGGNGTGTGAGSGTAGTGSSGTFDLSSLPADAQAAYKKALADAEAKARTGAKDAAAKAARDDLLGQISTALGLTTAAADPTKLAEQVSGLTASNRDLQIEVAVLRGASAAGADPDALADSRAFMAKVAKLDPTSDGFAGQLADAIKAHLEANPNAKAKGAPIIPAAGQTGSGSFDGGNGQSATSVPEDVDGMRALLYPDRVKK